MSTNCSFTFSENQTKTLPSVVGKFFAEQGSGVYTLCIFGNYHSSTTEGVVVPAEAEFGWKTVVITCRTLCIFHTNIHISSKSFNNQHVIVFNNVIFQDSIFTIDNIQVYFYKAEFVSAVIRDKGTRTGEFTEASVSFAEVIFHTNVSLLLNNTLVVHCSFSQCQVSSSSVSLHSSTLILSVANCSFTKSRIEVQGNKTVISHFDSVSLMKQKIPVLKVEAQKLKSVFLDVSISNSQGGLELVKKYSGLVDSWVEADLIGCTFTNNTKFGSGGALKIQLTGSDTDLSSGSYIIINQCTFAHNKLRPSTRMDVHGGAISVDSMLPCDLDIHNWTKLTNVTIISSSFVCNTAEKGGGAIYLSKGSINMTIDQCEFLHSHHLQSPTRGLFLLGHSDVSITNSTFTSAAHNDMISLIEIQLPDSTSQVGNLGITVNCLKWHRTRVENISMSEHQSNRLKMFVVFCESCSEQFYIPSDGSFKVSYSTSMASIRKDAMECVKCPFGGDCSADALRAKPNYWGYHTGEGIEFQQCPVGYCCEGSRRNPCKSHDACKGKRSGVLCSSCEEGYSQSILSNSCMANDECTSSWFWVIYFTGACTYMLWYTFKDDVLNVPVVLLNKLKVSRNAKSSGKTGVHYVEKGYFGILLYFVQASAIIRIHIQKSSPFLFENVTRTLETNLGLILTIELFYIEADVCPIPHLNLAHKQIAKFLFLICIYASWAAVFASIQLFNKVAKYLFGQKGRHKCRVSSDKLFGGLVKIIKYTCGVFTKVVFFSLLCVKLNNDFVWFSDASVKCMSLWQKAMLCFAVWYIVPFPFTLYLGMKLVERKQISGNSLLFGTLCPLPFFFSWLIKLSKPQTNTVKDGTVVKIFQAWSNNLEDVKMYNRFKRGYRHEGGAQYWECVMILRRLLLNLTAISLNSIAKQGLCLLLCVIFVIHHCHMKPHIYTVSNRLETLSLFLLCVCACSNGAKAIFLYLGESPDSPQAIMLSYLSLIETLFLPGLLLSIFVMEFWHCLSIRKLARVFVK